MSSDKLSHIADCRRMDLSHSNRYNSRRTERPFVDIRLFVKTVFLLYSAGAAIIIP